MRRLGRRLHGALRTIGTARSERRTFIQRLQHSTHAQYGWWVCTSMRSAIWVGTSYLSGWGLSISILTRIVTALSIREALHFLIASVVRPPVFRGGNRKDTHADPASVEVIMGRDDRLVILDRSNNIVTHDARIPYSYEYVQNRRHLQRFLPGPSFNLSGDGLVMSETLIEGRAFDNAPVHLRISLAREVISRIALMAQDTVMPPSTAWLEQCLARLTANSVLPELLSTAINQNHAKLRRLAAESPLTLSHGDLWAKNIIQDGSSWQVIDFDDVAPLPYFFDTYKLLGQDEHLRKALIAGSFESELTDLDQAVLERRTLPTDSIFDHKVKPLAAELLTLSMVTVAGLPSLLRAWEQPSPAGK